MSDELAQIASLAGGGGAVGGVILVKLIDRIFKSDEKRLATIETAVAQMSATLTPIGTSVEVIRKQFEQFSAELTRIDKRLEGVATNHGQRITAIEIALAKWMGRQEGLESAVGIHAAEKDIGNG